MPTSDIGQRITSARLAAEHVSQLDGGHLLFVGGELFTEQNKEVQHYLTELYVTARNKLKHTDRYLYINTNLLYADRSLLTQILDMFDDSSMLHQVKFTTSYDTYGRFSPFTKRAFDSNLREIRKQYPAMKIVVNMIMQKRFVDDILTGYVNVKDFIDAYDVDINTIPLITDDKTQAPSKAHFWSAIEKIDQSVPGYFERYVTNFALEQKVDLKQFQHTKFVDVSADTIECGHVVNFCKCYADSDECFICKCKQLKGHLDA